MFKSVVCEEWSSPNCSKGSFKASACWVITDLGSISSLPELDVPHFSGTTKSLDLLFANPLGTYISTYAHMMIYDVYKYSMIYDVYLIWYLIWYLMCIYIYISRHIHMSIYKYGSVPSHASGRRCHEPGSGLLVAAPGVLSVFVSFFLLFARRGGDRAYLSIICLFSPFFGWFFFSPALGCRTFFFCFAGGTLRARSPS